MNNDITKILNINNLNSKILNISSSFIDDTLYVYLKLKPSKHLCSFCSSETQIKDYTKRKIKHSISNNNPCYIIYYARRYQCKICNKTFYEDNPFVSKNNKISNYTKLAVLELLKDHTQTFTAIAKRFNVSVPTVINIFDEEIKIDRLKLPEAICIDEFYTSKSRQYKYACVFLDFASKKIIDVFPSRHSNKLGKELSFIPKMERLAVKFTIIDMYKPYQDLSKRFFPNAKIAVDSFHVIKHLNDAITKIRIKIMNKYNNKSAGNLLANDKYYYMLKKFGYFFTKEFDNIYNGLIQIQKLRTKWDKYTIRKYLLDIDKDLSDAYWLKEEYRSFNKTATYETFDEEFYDLLEKFFNSPFQEFRDFAGLLSRWKEEIKNSFIVYNGKRLSNGPIEGANSKIKTIFKSANGYYNFLRLRNRIMYSLNNKS